jgi:DNA-binding PadR family transcriptional regulator
MKPSLTMHQRHLMESLRRGCVEPKAGISPGKQSGMKRTLRSLEARGLIRGSGGYRYSLTDAGREALGDAAQ